MAVEPALLSEHLDVYDTRSGLWNPDVGNVEIPEGWELLHSGDAFVTRTVKAGGLWWTLWNPRSPRAEDRYRQELQSAITTFLALDDAHAGLAREIAAEASARAAVVGSGRVGRTRKLGVEERAELAARAYIRHRHTSYEDDLIDEVWDDDVLYRQVKRGAQAVVDAFLERHRPDAGPSLG